MSPMWKYGVCNKQAEFDQIGNTGRYRSRKSMLWRFVYCYPLERIGMTKRKNLKIAKDTYDDLKEEKRDMETWDSFQRRLLRAVREGDDE